MRVKQYMKSISILAISAVVFVDYHWEICMGAFTWD